tara:strand:- start:112 stop:1116 length:1005 start_codon:yes stop_codon:yes gene_type:complete
MAKSIQEFSNIDISSGDKDLQLSIETLPAITTIIVLHIKNYSTSPEQITLTLDTHYTYNATSKIVTLKQGSFTISDSTDKVSVLRVTDISDPSVSFSDTSLLTDTNLNQSVRQTLFKLQEVSEQNQEGYDTASLSLSGLINTNTANITAIQANDYVTNERLATGAVTSEKIFNGTIKGEDFDSASVKTFMGDLLYPLGSVYCNMLNSADPATILGFGSWTRIQGKAVVGYNSSETEFDTLLETGGSKTVTLDVDELPPHRHETTSTASTLLWGEKTSGRNSDKNNYFNGNSADGDGGRFQISSFMGTGSDQGLLGNSHNNLQPYIVGSLWYRSA